MADKRRYTVTVPDHVADAVEAHATKLGATPTEYASDVLRWWFGQGCPSVTHDEAALRRLKPLPENLDVWSLNPNDVYAFTDDAVVTLLLTQLELPNLFVQEAEHESVRMCVAFDNHPTHWLRFDFFKGSTRSDGDGLAFTAYPKSSTTRQEMLRKLKDVAKDMESAQPISFSQIPALEKKKSGNQTPTKVLASS